LSCANLKETNSQEKDEAWYIELREASTKGFFIPHLQFHRPGIRGATLDPTDGWHWQASRGMQRDFRIDE
jgi:hypothetical protein